MFDYGKEYYRRRESRPTFQAEVAAVVQWLSLQPEERVLELGCGGGSALAQLAQNRNLWATGMDWLPTSIALAGERATSFLLVAGDAQSLPFADECFDKVFAQHLIEHFETPFDIIHEWARVLAPGGRLALVTPNARFPIQDWFDDPTHYQIFLEEELVALVTTAGLEVIEHRTINPFFLHWRFTDVLARYFQFIRHLPAIGRRGMSLLVVAAKTTANDS